MMCIVSGDTVAAEKLTVNIKYYSFIHSGYFYSASSSPHYSEELPTQQDTVLEFNAEAPHGTVSERLAQGPYVAARVGVEPMTFRTKGVDSTNAPHTPRASSCWDEFIIIERPISSYVAVWDISQYS